jgi:hypothetical protein
MLASAAGYDKLSSEQVNTVYDKYAKDIDVYANSRRHWQNSSNKQIAYLLEQKIYSNGTLPTFVIVTGDGKHLIRNLRREEMAVYLVRLMGKEDEAKKANYDIDITDISSIRSDKVPYVKYLVKAKIFSLNSEEKFRPNETMKRAEMAIALDKIMNGINVKTETKPEPVKEPVEVKKELEQEINLDEYIDGSIKSILPNNKFVVILNPETKKTKLFKFAEDVNVYIDDVKMSKVDLEEGSKVKYILNEKSVSEIRVYSESIESKLPVVVKEDSKNMIGVVKKVVIARSPILYVEEDGIVRYYKFYDDKNILGLRTGTKLSYNKKGKFIENFKIIK